MLGRAMRTTTTVVPGPRANRMSRMRALLYFISGWVTLLTGIFLVHCDRLGKAAEEEQYKIVSRVITMPDAKRCEDPTAPVYVNDSFHIPAAIEANRTSRSRCHLTRTRTATVYGLPKIVNGTIELTAGSVHEIRIVSLGPTGENRCAGGDYYETDLIGKFWRSRPPVIDIQDGSYRVYLQVDMRFAGLFVFRIILLFSNFHGLDPPPDSLPMESNSPWARMEEIRNVKIRFVIPTKNSERKEVTCSPHLATCCTSDFSSRQWMGRWTREEFNLLCESDHGRSPSKCLKPDAQCVQPWCRGPVGLLHSNGWVYSAHCSFKIFTRDEAWSCLNRKWLFWVGDSTELETLRNLLTTVLGLEEVDSTLGLDGVDHKFIRLESKRTLNEQEDVQSQSIGDSDQRSDNTSPRHGGRPNGSQHGPVRDSRPHEKNLNYRFIQPRIYGDVRVHAETPGNFPLHQRKRQLIRSEQNTGIPGEAVRESTGEDEKLPVLEQPIHIRKPLGPDVGNKFTGGGVKQKLGKYDQFLRVSFIHNDHADRKSFQPLYSPANTKFLESIKMSFFWGTTPDFIVVDFGLRNHWYFQNAASFIEGLKLAVSFFRNILHELFPRFPLFIYRSASAVAGRTRTTFVNPHKVELYNRIIAEKLQALRNERLPNVRILDTFDMSFPWHFNHNGSSDGVHYGTAPNECERHEHFVNLMFVHILLNSMCEAPAPLKRSRLRSSGH